VTFIAGLIPVFSFGLEDTVIAFFSGKVSMLLVSIFNKRDDKISYR
jgi:hypothetical protein